MATIADLQDSIHELKLLIQQNTLMLDALAKDLSRQEDRIDLLSAEVDIMEKMHRECPARAHLSSRKITMETIRNFSVILGVVIVLLKFLGVIHWG